MSAARTEADRHSADSWFASAVFYELSVKSFFDANGDGIGDFAGLTQKLDYIESLGADCIWLLPFFPSPLHDDGYDVADYRAVHPAFGSIDDFRAFVATAHERNLRVAAEMVINHTSTEHPWFQAARTAPPNSPLRNFYVWSDTPKPLTAKPRATNHPREAGWTWDETAGAFYWHRFTSHQPDLNYDNPAVVEEMLKVLRFWADLGIDGLCLNGVAHLVERPDAGPEHLRETHAVLKHFRSELQDGYPHLMLQAGVNAWPTDTATYFGDGHQCQAAPHLPLATRLFLALKQENRQPLVDILLQTPPAPAGCQWITLLRNHDELTLSLATDEERDYLFQEYAADPAMRLYGGICRRLAPLVDNSRSRIELLFSLLFGLPGAPVIYYGDELGMGDNVLLRGRSAVRTPMQWTADRNGGFSGADFAHLTVPPVMDPVYGYQAVNVAAQQRDASSLLHWMRRLIAIRKRHPVLAHGKFKLLEPSNQKTLAFVRQFDQQAAGNETILVVANLARSAQATQLDLSAYRDLIPVEMFGRSAFPPIGRQPYVLSLAPYGIFWFSLQAQAPVVTRLLPVQTQAVADLPTIESAERDETLFEGDACRTLQSVVLPAYLLSQRWFGGKARQIREVRVTDWGRLPCDGPPAFQVSLHVEFADGQRDIYSLPMTILSAQAALDVIANRPMLAIARLADGGAERLLCDALASDDFSRWLLAAVQRQSHVPLKIGALAAEPTPALGDLLAGAPGQLPVILGPATSSNSLVFFGRRLMFKLFRRLERGTNPDYEIGSFLTRDRRFARTPPVAGKIDYRERGQDAPMTVGILQALVSNQGDGWGHAIDELSRYFDRASTRMFAPDPLHPDLRPAHELASAAPPPAAIETIAGYLHSARTLGRRTAEMHLALAGDASSPEFAPEPLTEADMRRIQAEIAFQADLVKATLANQLTRLPGRAAEHARRLLDQLQPALARMTAACSQPPQATKTRIHGDYHLGQVLWVDNDYVILDFEGEPTRSVEERREKFSPLRDVAAMLRSYHYAAYAGLFAFTQDRPADFPRLVPWADLWQQWISAAFLAEYRRTAAGASFLPQDERHFALLLDAFMLAKALYELVYELNNRPDWVRIPLSGVLHLLRL